MPLSRETFEAIMKDIEKNEGCCNELPVSLIEHILEQHLECDVQTVQGDPNISTGRNPAFTIDDYQKLLQDKIKHVVAQQEEIITAFIAKYGMHPDEIEQVEVEHPNGRDRTWYVRKRAKAVPTVERVKGMIEERMEINKRLNFIRENIELKDLLKEISEAEDGK